MRRRKQGGGSRSASPTQPRVSMAEGLMRPPSPSPDTSPRSSSGAPEQLATSLLVASHLHFVCTQIKLSNVVCARARSCASRSNARLLLLVTRARSRRRACAHAR